MLDIKDGNEKKRFALTDEQLHDGNMKYVRKSEDLEMRMIVFPEKQGGIQQFVRLVSPQAASSIKLEAKEETSPPESRLTRFRHRLRAQSAG